MADILDRKQLQRDHYRLPARFMAAARQHLDKVCWGGALAWAVAPVFPVTSLVASLFFLVGAADANVNSPRGPFFKPRPGKRVKLPEWTRLEGPKDKGGKGDWFIGNAMDTGEEIWTTDDVLRRHMLLFGTTGSGKTVTLEGYIYQAIAHGSGVIFVDGKADPKTWFDVYSMAKMQGRENDLRVLNFITGTGVKVDVGFTDEEQEAFAKIESNTFNPFTQGNSDTLTELVVGLMRPEGSGDGGMWRGRAEAMIRSLMKALCELRDRGLMNMTVDNLRQHMTLEKIGELDQHPELPELCKSQIKSYLDELPGYRAGMDCEEGSQDRMQFMEQAEKQHGFLTMQFTELLGLLAGTYKHIFDVEHGEIDFQDVVYNRRILLVMLPALEKSPSSLANLGRICVAGIKNALSVSLKGQLTGTKRAIVDSRPTNSETALLAIMDEYGSYAVEGFGDVVAQARSLGVSAIFSGQDYPSFTKGSEIEAKRIWANTGLKVFLKTEDSETADLAIKRSGEANYLMLGGKKEIVPGTVVDNQEVGWQQQTRLMYRDLVDQSEGWGFLLYGDFCIQFNAFYVPIDVSSTAKHNVMFPLGADLHKKYRARLKSYLPQSGSASATAGGAPAPAEAGDPLSFSLFNDPGIAAAIAAGKPGEVPSFPNADMAEQAGVGAPVSRRDAKLLDDLDDMVDESTTKTEVVRVSSLLEQVKRDSQAASANGISMFGEELEPKAKPVQREVTPDMPQEDTDMIFGSLTDQLIVAAKPYINLNDDDGEPTDNKASDDLDEGLAFLSGFFCEDDVAGGQQEETTQGDGADQAGSQQGTEGANESHAALVEDIFGDGGAVTTVRLND